MRHAGTLVAHGTGTAVVVTTGAATELGHIVSLLHERSAPTHRCNAGSPLWAGERCNGRVC